MKIVPSILVGQEKEFAEQLEKLTSFFNRFQIDIADGKFVPNTTLQIEDVKKILKNYKLSLDFHLMVFDYRRELNKLEVQKEMDVNTAFVHFASHPDPGIFERNPFRFSLGIVLNPNEEIDKLQEQYPMEFIQNIQLMTVNPGFQGSAFHKESLTKIEQLRNANYRNKIFLDGGINERTLSTITSRPFKPDVLCIGSYLSQASNLEENVKKLNALISSVA